VNWHQPGTNHIANEQLFRNYMFQRKTCHGTIIVLIRKNVQQSLYRPGQAVRVSEGEALRFQDIQFMKIIRL